MKNIQLILCLLLLVSGTASLAREALPPSRELHAAIAFENDLLAGSGRDRDYTYGINLSFSGDEVEQWPISPSSWQAWLDATLQVHNHNHNVAPIHRVEYGAYAFTPENIEASQVQSNDRPYASLVYAQSTKESVRGNINWISSLSVGALGLDFAGSAQNKIHSLTGGKEARGWRHQISDGGELTAKYALARQRYWALNSPRFELKTTSQLSVGYLSEVSQALSFRWGDIHSAWWRFAPSLSAYNERAGYQLSNHRIPEHFFWGGIAIKARAYNAFLQGQWRDSERELSAGELNHILVEAWLGYTWALANGVRITYQLRGHSSEISSGDGNRSLLWGGLSIAMPFD